jgi:hypothetical protein
LPLLYYNNNSGNGPYVIVTTSSSYQGQCTDGTIYSSATYDAQVKDISQALGFTKPTVLWSQ